MVYPQLCNMEYLATSNNRRCFYGYRAHQFSPLRYMHNDRMLRPFVNIAMPSQLHALKLWALLDSRTVPIASFWHGWIEAVDALQIFR